MAQGQHRTYLRKIFEQAIYEVFILGIVGEFDRVLTGTYYACKVRILADLFISLFALK